MLTLGHLRRGTGDPTFAIGPDGSVWRASRTPDGPATLRVEPVPTAGAVAVAAWGPGAGWELDHAAELLGLADDRAGFDPGLPLLDRLARRFAGWRVGRAGRVWEALLPAVLEQQVTNTEAWAGFRRLVRRFGEPAPGPGTVPLVVPPAPRVWASLPSWEWHRAGVGPRRARVAAACAARAGALERLAAGGSAVDVDAALRSLPGIGPWTSAEVRQRAFGDPDAVSVGDAHLPANVGWALVGERLDDAGMLAVLDRWRGHRYRVTRLVELAGITAPRHGPRVAPRDIRAL